VESALEPVSYTLDKGTPSIVMDTLDCMSDEDLRYDKYVLLPVPHWAVAYIRKHGRMSWLPGMRQAPGRLV
jgi:hypothetical protein